MNELEKLKNELAKQNAFIENLVDELKDVYTQIDSMRKESIIIAQAFKSFLTAVEGSKQQ